VLYNGFCAKLMLSVRFSSV